MRNAISWVIIAWWLLGEGHAVLAEESIEGSLPLNKFRFESSGKARPGPVTVSGTQTENGISSLNIEAFGETFALGPAQIQKLRGLAINSMRLSFWTEYPEYGGWRIQLWIGLTLMSGVQKEKIIIVNERGDVHINDVAK
jgi:hypothetical protein